MNKRRGTGSEPRGKGREKKIFGSTIRKNAKIREKRGLRDGREAEPQANKKATRKSDAQKNHGRGRHTRGKALGKAADRSGGGNTGRQG